jgi:hypothetical protein
MLVGVGGANVLLSSPDGGNRIAWSSDRKGITRIGVVANGTLHNYYEYDGSLLSDSFLTAPIVNGTLVKVTHIDICFNPEYDFTVNRSVTAVASYKRTYDWSISSTDESATLGLGQQATIPVHIGATAVAIDSDFAVDGAVTVLNNTSKSITISSAQVNLPGAVVSGAVPVTLLPGETATWDYHAAVADTAAGSVQASVIYTVENACLLNDRTETVSADFAFGAPQLVDNGVTMTLGSDSITVADAGSSEGVVPLSTYLTVGPYSNCGNYQVPYTGKLVTFDTQTVVTLTSNLRVTIPCVSACVLDADYWKSHSTQGSSSYDDAWNSIGAAGPATIFFLSSQSYSQVISVPPAGNPYYTLAKQYVSALLNQINGANVPEDAAAAIADATALFGAYTPAQVGATSTQSALRKQFKDLQARLALYNSGGAGVPACVQ